MSGWRRAKAGIALLIISTLTMPQVAVATAAGTEIVLDGEFDDWDGKARLEDPADDTKHHWDDVRYWYWATNEGESAIYFMVERYWQHGQYSDAGGSASPGLVFVASPEVTDPSKDKSADKASSEKQAEPEIEATPAPETVTQPETGTPPQAPATPQVEAPPTEGLVQSVSPEAQTPAVQAVPSIDPQGLPPASGFMKSDAKKDKKQVHYTIFIDTDNNGEFEDPQDVVVYADYYPAYDGLVYVTVFRGRSHWDYSGYWGETEDEGGFRCEFSVSFKRLGIEPGQTLRMVLFAQDKRSDWDHPDPMSDYEDLVERREADRVPDIGDLQWAPVSTLGDFGFVLLVGAAMVIPTLVQRRKRKL